MKVSIVGATGYGGIELIRLLHHHPYAEITSFISGSQAGENLADIYPHLTDVIQPDLDEWNVERIAREADLVFFSTPAGVSKEYLPQAIAAGTPCIDLSGDFRLNNPELYATWYKKEPAKQADLDQAAYGLCELYAANIREARAVANPGCYPTAALLALIPALREGLVEPNSIIIDGKTGVSGAGRSLSLNTHFSETNENVKAYKLGQHQHIPEIEQVLTDVAGKALQVTFSTHLTPMTRGILCTCYANLKEPHSTTDIIEYYEQFYARHPFVRVRPEGTWPATKEVYGSNYCDLGFMADERTGRLTVVSVIDNVVKGAAGQAIQNMNILQGWPEETGLTGLPVYP